MTHTDDYICTQREPRCHVWELERAHILRMKDLDDTMRHIEMERYERERTKVMRQNCQGCGWEWTENEIRKEHPAPWKRKNDGTVFRDWRRKRS